MREQPRDAGRIYFGAWFDLEEDGGGTQRFRLVGPDEFDRARENLSMDSPLGKAALGKSLDQQFEVYRVVAISYAAPDAQ